MSNQEQIRFGQVLVGQDFKRIDSPHVWRRIKGAFAQPVQYIGGHISLYGGSQCPIDLGEMVVPVPKSE